MHNTLSAAARAAAALVCICALSCADKSAPAEGRVKPRGRLLENGLPLKVDTTNMPPGDPGMKITFVRLGSADAGEEIAARIFEAAEGSFELIGADGKGIPPGKYRVTVTVGPEGGADRLKGKYSRDKSKIEVEVKEGQDLVIDVANYK